MRYSILSELKICEILVERFGLEKELSKNHFSLTDAKTLYNDEFNDFKFIVSSLLPQGLSILAGSPKIGKSWFVLWLCIQVSNGEKVWEYETLKGTTLYLSLEDNLRRLQNRLLKLTDCPPENMFITTMANTLNGVLLSEHTKPACNTVRVYGVSVTLGENPSGIVPSVTCF